MNVTSEICAVFLNFEKSFKIDNEFWTYQNAAGY